jgi:dolichyl-phosphate beta-glucosyltransferase
MIKLSVIIPAYNEEKRIEKTLRSVDSYLEKQNYSYEIIVVDNHSNDKTFEVVKKLESTVVQNAKAIRQHIRGKGAAVKMGVENAHGEYLMYMDADNSTPISEIEKFWPELEAGNEVVIGDRYMDKSHKAKQPLLRTILSRGSNLLIQTVLGMRVNDTQAGFKAFKSDAAKKIFKHVTINGFAFDMELLAIARNLRYRIRAVPIMREEHGGSTVPPSAFIQSLRDLFIIKWNFISGKYTNK